MAAGGLEGGNTFFGKNFPHLETILGGNVGSKCEDWQFFGNKKRTQWAFP